MKLKTQKKYITLTVSIDLNEAALGLWNEGVWTTPLGGLPVRWFPATWDLKQRKERERFQAVVMDIPDSITTKILYPEDNPAHSILSPLGCKVVQDKGRCKLITYYNSWADLDKIINTNLSLQEFTGVWKRYYAPSLNKPRNRFPKKDLKQKQNQDSNPKAAQNTNQKLGKNFKVAKQFKKVEKGLDGIDKLTVLAEIRSMLRKLTTT